MLVWRLVGSVLVIGGCALAVAAASAAPGGKSQPRLGAFLSAALTVGVLLLAAALIVGGVVTGWRLRARRRRRLVRLRLMPGRTDEASPQRVAKLLEVIHQLLLRRWWQRLLDGQPGVALEFTLTAGGVGAEARLSIVLPDDASLIRAVRGRLEATYRDVLVIPDGELPADLAAVVRLKKRSRFIHALKTPDAYDEPLADAVLGTMAGMAEASVVQYALVPAPVLFDRVARWRFRAVEVERERARMRQTGDPGLRSELVEAELERALHSQHRPLFFADIRVAAHTRAAAQLVARAVRGESAQENRLVERRLHRRGRLGLYLRRVREGRPNPLPGIRRGVLSSSELAGLWHLPSPFLSGVPLGRNPVPRLPAPPGIARVSDASCALGADGDGLLALRDADKFSNLALLGRPGAGKTSVMLRSALADAADPNCALIILDPKGELADAALGLLPADGKPVHVISLADGEAGIDPFHVPGGSPQTIAAGIVSALKAVTEDAQGASQIGFSSDRYIRQAAIAAAEREPDMWKLWRLLNASEGPYRDLIAARLRGQKGLEQTELFLGQELPHQLARSPANFITRLDAPANKAIRTTTGPLDVCFRHPHRIDVDEVIANREVLVVNGCAGAVETEDVAVVMQFALVFIHQALLRQQALPRSKRARVALKVDEAHLGIFSHKFAELLALGRSSGLECVCAFLSPSQIPDRGLRAKVFDLLANWCVFACGEDAARELSALLQTVYSDVQRDDPAARERQRITTDALINLPRHWFAASWLADGARTPPFVAHTLPMANPDASLREHHLAAQRGRGAHRLTPETMPVEYRSVGKQDDAGLGDETAGSNSEALPPQEHGYPSGGGVASADPPNDGEQLQLLEAEDDERDLQGVAPNRDVETGADPQTGGGEEAAEPAATDAAGAGELTRPPREADDPRAEPGTVSADDTGAARPGRASPPSSGDRAEPQMPRRRSRPASGSPSRRSGGPDDGAGRPRAAATAQTTGPIPATALITLSELDAYAHPRALKWEDIEPVPKGERREPTIRELAILAALVELRLLTAPQIHRRFLPQLSERTLRAQLQAMCAQGWLRRAHLTCEGPGQTPRIFALAQGGWEQVKDARTRFRPFCVDRADWRAPELSDPRRIAHDLHANAWYLAFERIAGHVVASVRGPHSARLYPPSKPHPDYRHDPTKRLPLSADEIAERLLGTGQRFDSLAADSIAPIYPDLAIEVSLPKLPRRPRQHYLIEVERSRHPAGLKSKLVRYDALITAWGRGQEPFLTAGLPPAVIFVCPDEPFARAACKIADQLVRGRIASLEDRPPAWPYPGRKRMFFVAERDVHLGSLRAAMVPELPPTVRRQAMGLEGKRMPFRPVLRPIIRSEVLAEHS
jgi:hypothetical protein